MANLENKINKIRDRLESDYKEVFRINFILNKLDNFVEHMESDGLKDVLFNNLVFIDEIDNEEDVAVLIHKVREKIDDFESVLGNIMGDYPVPNPSEDEILEVIGNLEEVETRYQLLSKRKATIENKKKNLVAIRKTVISYDNSGPHNGRYEFYLDKPENEFIKNALHEVASARLSQQKLLVEKELNKISKQLDEEFPLALNLPFSVFLE